MFQRKCLVYKILYSWIICVFLGNFVMFMFSLVKKLAALNATNDCSF